MNATAPGIWTEALLTAAPDSWFIKGTKVLTAPGKAFRNMAKEVAGINEIAAAERLAIEEAMPLVEQVAAKKGIKQYEKSTQNNRDLCSWNIGTVCTDSADHLHSPQNSVEKRGGFG